MTSYTIMICTEPYKFQATDSLINLGEAIINKGNRITGIFFYGSGVYNIKVERFTFLQIIDQIVADLKCLPGEFCALILIDNRDWQVA